ncbi:MAG: carbohydrate ABC transporter permease [Firmicutes bacterium]|jgi:multiple sugar transport system permease protein|nr:carbohydrate ABC transporter permease [Bacillota bacterium]
MSPVRISHLALPRLSQAAITVVLVVAAATMLLPFVWLALSALKTRAELVAVPPVWIPEVPQYQNFALVVRQVPLFRYYLNSFIVAGGISLSVLITSSMAGFALAKYQFPGRDLVFRGILATMMLPSFIFIIPVYYMMKHVPFAGGNDWAGVGGTGFLHSRLSLILPFAVSAWGIFLMRQFMLGIPDSLIDAARIDGASEMRILLGIMMPSVKPALATVGIFTFISQWNNLFWPLVVATSAPELATLTVGLKFLETSFDPNRNAHLILAGLTLGILPVMILFASLQRYYVKGISMTGIKG